MEDWSRHPANQDFTAEMKLEVLRSRDPIVRWKETPVAEGLIDEAGFGEMDAGARADVGAAVKFAENSPPPAAKIGRHFFD